MLRHYAAYTFRKWWPLLLVACIVFASIMGYAALSIPTTYQGYTWRSNEQGVYLTFAITPLVVGFGFSFVFPMFVHSYRTKKRSVDTYYQSAVDSRTVRRIHMLIALCMLVIAYTGGFLIGTIVYLLRFLGTPEVAQGSPGAYNGDGNIYRLGVRFPILALIYLIVLIILLSQFFINTFLASLGNYVFDQICLMVFGNVFLALLFIAPYLYLAALTKATGSDVYNGLYYSFGNIGPIALLNSIIIPSFMGNTPAAGPIVHASIGTFISLCASAGCCLGSFFLKDPSGEYANSKKPIHPTVHLIPHGAAACIGFLFCISGSVNGLASSYAWLSLIVLPFFLYILYAVGYFMILALWRHTFRMSKVDWICFIAVAGSTLLLLIGQVYAYAG